MAVKSALFIVFDLSWDKDLITVFLESYIRKHVIQPSHNPASGGTGNLIALT